MNSMTNATRPKTEAAARTTTVPARNLQIEEDALTQLLNASKRVLTLDLLLSPSEIHIGHLN